MLFKILPTIAWFHILSICYGSTHLQVSKYVLVFYRYLKSYHVGFPGNATGKKLACQCRRHKRQGFNPWVGKIPWRRGWQPTPVFLPEKSYGQRSLAGYSPWGSQSLTQLKWLSTQKVVIQGVQLRALWWPRGVGSEGWEAQQGGDICILIADSCC